jgi:hypothetical protein
MLVPTGVYLTQDLALIISCFKKKQDTPWEYEDNFNTAEVLETRREVGIAVFCKQSGDI